MRVITFPDHVVLRTDGGATLDATFFVLGMLNLDQRFNQTGAGVRAGTRIEKAFPEPGIRVMRLQPDDWVLLRDACDTPTNGYPIQPARRCQPFMDAISAAVEEP